MDSVSDLIILLAPYVERSLDYQLWETSSFLFLFGVFVVITVIALRCGINAWKLKTSGLKSLPGPVSLPMFGHVKTVCCSSDLHLYLTDQHRTHGEVYQVNVGQHKLVVIGSLHGILEGLLGRESVLNKRPNFKNFQHIFDREGTRNRGILTSDLGKKTKVMKAFLSASIDAFCSDVSHIEAKLSSEIIHTVNCLMFHPSAISPIDVLEPACFNIMFSLIFSQRFDPQSPVLKETLITLNHRSSMLSPGATEFCPLLKVFNTDDNVLFVQDRTQVQLELHKKYLNLHKDTYDPQHIRDMTDHLLLFLENGDDQGLLTKTDQDFLLLDALNFGYRSMAVSLSWLLGYMADNPEVQKEVQAEIDSVVGRDRLPGLDDQPFLPLTTAAIMECSRLATIHPFLFYHSASQDTAVQGFHIPKSSVLLFNIWNLHHDPKLWAHPNTFKPSRFLNCSGELEIPNHYMPYGLGQRQCPGESLSDVCLFLLFTTILHQCDLEPKEGFPITGQLGVLLQPSPFTVTINKRL